MGGGSSTENSAQKKKRDEEIANMMSDQDDKEKKTKKILLLGSGECGKTTILKQFKIIMANGFSDDDKELYATTCRKNSVHAIQSLINAVDTLSDIEGIESASALEASAALLDLGDKIPNDADSLTTIKENIKLVWVEDSIQAAFARSGEFQLLDSTKYFLTTDEAEYSKFDGNNGQPTIERVFSPDFVPNDQDILRARIMTTGVQQTEFKYTDQKENNAQPITFRVFDVGGQRGERKKWIHAFDDVTAILFIASLSEYDQVLAEDNQRNRLDESLDLFEGIVNLTWFQGAAVILFLNKCDLFEMKIKDPKRQLANVQNKAWCYTGPDHDYDAGCEFVTSEYKERNEDDERTIYTHITNATNTENVEIIWKAVTQLILTNKFKDAGML